MSKAISELLISEMIDDYAASAADIAICKKAMNAGIKHHLDGFPIKTRIEKNMEIMRAIRAEILRREQVEKDILAKALI